LTGKIETLFCPNIGVCGSGVRELDDSTVVSCCVLGYCEGMYPVNTCCNAWSVSLLTGSGL